MEEAPEVEDYVLTADTREQSDKRTSIRAPRRGSRVRAIVSGVYRCRIGSWRASNKAESVAVESRGARLNSAASVGVMFA